MFASVVGSGTPAGSNPLPSSLTTTVTWLASKRHVTVTALQGSVPLPCTTAFVSASWTTNWR